MKKLFVLIILIFSFQADALWEENRPTPVDGLSNPYNLTNKDLENHIRSGRLHALHYPVEVTGLLLPYHPIKKILDSESENPLKKMIYKVLQGMSKVKSFDDMNRWLGLHEYPAEEGDGAYFVPQKSNLVENRMGFSIIERNNAQGFTHSCTACHSSNLFGRKIIGLTNRFPRANEYFVKGKKALSVVDGAHFRLATGATNAEIQMLLRTKDNLRFIEAKKPVQLGLDTSLAHVALSLSRRAKNEHADKNIKNFLFPRQEQLRHFVADSKPGVWWNVKYKNKWLLDGAVVSGNPILTNILWNELGRGTDLHELENWMEDNQAIIEELTTAVFANESPKMTDFFSEEYFNLEKARAGQKVYQQTQCTKCHGTYHKAWDLPDAHRLGWQDKFQTIRVEYPEQTPIKNVGTDVNRWKGMSSLVQLNDLAISKKYGVITKAQQGYVPPPLVGIWARWPYFHNNSIPNLCALMTPPSERPTSYYAGEARDPNVDFDFSCNGYPLGIKTPASWKLKEYFFDTTRAGLGNSGHYQKIFLDEKGSEILTGEEKSALIHFLQTL